MADQTESPRKRRQVAKGLTVMLAMLVPMIAVVIVIKATADRRAQQPPLPSPRTIVPTTQPK